MGESLNVSLPLQFCGCKARQRSPNLHNLYNWRQLKYVSPYFPYFPKYLSSCCCCCMQSPDKSRPARFSKSLTVLLIGLMVVGCIDNNGGDPIGRLGDRQIEGRELHNGDNQRERRGKGKTEGKGNRREGRDLLLSSWETEIGGR